MAASFNHLYGEHFTLPEAAIDEHVATLPGLDGRKMSKSYDNTIPLFSSRDQLKKLIGGILTDSRAPGEPKDVEGSALFQIYQAFATPEETEALRKLYAEGIAWGDAKQLLFERIDRDVAPMRERYDDLMAHPEKIEQTLLAGAERARQIATPFVRKLRSAVGLRSLAQASAAPKAAKAAKTALPSFKQYREADGQFYFKFVAADGRLLLQHGLPRQGCGPGHRPPAAARRAAAAQLAPSKACHRTWPPPCSNWPRPPTPDGLHKRYYFNSY
jgi:tryptophanyl-tRNA synthetase